MRKGWCVTDDVPLRTDTLSGTVGQISFRRLAEQLRKAGEIRPTERIGNILCDFESGNIQYTVEPK